MTCSDYKNKMIGIFRNSVCLAFGYLQLIVGLATIIVYCIMILKYTTDLNYIIILLFMILMEFIASSVFVIGYEKNKVLYLSWFYFTNYLLVAMKLAIGFIFLYFFNFILVCPYVPLLFVDIVLLFSIRRELKAHKKTAEVRFEFVNQLAAHENVITIMVPNKMVENVCTYAEPATNDKEEKKDIVNTSESGDNATESVGANKIITCNTDML